MWGTQLMQVLEQAPSVTRPEVRPWISRTTSVKRLSSRMTE